MVKKDEIRPHLRQVRAQLEELQKMTIHVGIQSTGDQFNASGQRIEGADAKLATIASVHEYGATIHPRHAKNLAIPIDKEADGKSPRDFPGIIFIEDPDTGHVFGAMKTGEQGKAAPARREDRPMKAGGKKTTASTRDYKHQDSDDDLKFLFLLLPEVSIPERSFIRAGFDHGREDLQAAYTNGVERIITGEWTAEQAAHSIGAAGVAAIQRYMMGSNLAEKSDITKETSVSANRPLYNTGIMFTSLSYTIERKG